jgi:hypothetical protein
MPRLQQEPGGAVRSPKAMRLAVAIGMTLAASGCFGSGPAADPAQHPTGRLQGAITVGQRCGGTGGAIGGCIPAVAYRGIVRFCPEEGRCATVRPGRFGWFAVELAPGIWRISVGPRSTVYGQSTVVSLTPTSVDVAAGTIHTVRLHALTDG